MIKWWRLMIFYEVKMHFDQRRGDGMASLMGLNWNMWHNRAKQISKQHWNSCLPKISFIRDTQAPNQSRKENCRLWFQNFISFSFETNGFENLGKSNINYVMAWAIKCEFITVLTPICVAALAHLVWPKFVMQIRPVVWSHFHFIHIYSPGAALKSHDCRQLWPKASKIG